MTELLFEKLRGGYVHSNRNPNTSLNAYLTGTTAAKYVMPGWEVAWLYMKHPPEHTEMNPIRIGEYSYQLIGSKSDILGLLAARKQQEVHCTRTTTVVGSATGAYVPDQQHRNRGAQSAQEEYFFGGGTHARTMSGTLQLTVSAPQEAPSTLAREAMLAMGANFVGVGGGAFAGIKTALDLAEFFDDAVGEITQQKSLKGQATDKIKKLLKFMLVPDKVILELTLDPSPGSEHLPLPTTFDAINKKLATLGGHIWPH